MAMTPTQAAHLQAIYANDRSRYWQGLFEAGIVPVPHPAAMRTVPMRPVTGG